MMASRMGAGIDLVVKFGGSLFSRGDLRDICSSLDYSLREVPAIIVPGGGILADEVRRLDMLHSLGPESSHWMAVLAIDQNGLMLADLLPRGIPVRSFEGFAASWEEGRLPVFLPGELLFETDPLPKNWDVTSDSIACWAAVSMGAKNLLFLKDNVPECSMTAKVLSNQGWLDKTFPDQFEAFEGEAWIGNGCFPEEAVNGQGIIEILR
ncbi:MAG TPA: amino acid kinase [Synergistetes bacterium]|nr:amino acid kinase [Synergistota bacterium]